MHRFRNSDHGQRNRRHCQRRNGHRRSSTAVVVVTVAVFVASKSLFRRSNRCRSHKVAVSRSGRGRSLCCDRRRYRGRQTQKRRERGEVGRGAGKEQALSPLPLPRPGWESGAEMRAQSHRVARGPSSRACILISNLSSTMSGRCSGHGWRGTCCVLPAGTCAPGGTH